MLVVVRCGAAVLMLLGHMQLPGPPVLTAGTCVRKSRCGAEHVGIGGDFDGCGTDSLVYCLTNVSYCE